MLSVTDLRASTTFEDQGEIYQVLTYEHIKMGRGTAKVKLKVKNLKTQAITSKTFISGAKVKRVELTKKKLQFLYQDGDKAQFMDPKTFEQMTIPLRVISGPQLLKEGREFEVSFFNQEPLGLVLPPKMEFKVAETGPSLRGNSATNIYKEARLENGLKIKVPLFIKIGDKILLDTRTFEYSQKK